MTILFYYFEYDKRKARVGFYQRNYNISHKI